MFRKPGGRKASFHITVTVLKWGIVVCLLLVSLANIAYFASNYRAEAQNLQKLKSVVVQKARSSASTLLRRPSIPIAAKPPPAAWSEVVEHLERAEARHLSASRGAGKARASLRCQDDDSKSCLLE